ncbi:MAG: YdgA family protein [Campylobacteraceae bacterium]|jgi:hypothetical protein|nr:YdgA family protein [Campylobacteraceae bacterium]
MRKLLLLILGFLVVIVGFFAFSVVYSKSKVNLFFTANDGVLYKDNMRGITWKVSSPANETLNGEYTTEVLFYDTKIAVLEHKVKFGFQSLNLFKIGSIETEIKTTEADSSESEFGGIYDFRNVIAPDELRKAFNFLSSTNLSSDIRFSGIDIKIDLKEGSKKIESKDEIFDLTWKDVKGNYLVSFEKDTIDLDFEIPYFASNMNSAEGGNASFVIENQRYAGHVSKRKVGIWLGVFLTKIDKISVESAFKKETYNYDNYYDYGYDDYSDDLDDSDEYYDEPSEDYTASKDEEEVEIVNTNFVLSGLEIASNTKEGDNSTITSNSIISAKNFALGGEDNLTLDDIVFNVDFQNIDLQSMKKILDSFENIDLQSATEVELLLFGTSFLSYIPDILAKHPKIVINELSAKYANQTHKIDGFAQYIGSGDLQKVYANIDNDIVMKINFDLGENLFREFFRQKAYKNSYGYDTEDKEAFEKNVANEITLNIGALEERFGVKPKDGAYKGIFEFKNGDFLMNGKPYEVNADIF